MLAGLALLVLVVGTVRNHAPADAGVQLGVLALALFAFNWLAPDLRAHPANFPAATASHGLRVSGPRR
jgi:hypothetical protein